MQNIKIIKTINLNNIYYGCYIFVIVTHMLQQEQFDYLDSLTAHNNIYLCCINTCSWIKLNDF
ncbi:hypothetical protein LCDV1gp065 [Lymphocystis disease virus 1]|uniref:hypothetical protein n=1 Tax=Fish lymphocystis disease virus TaxID=36363 RepID=UPI0000161F05|nr:hypothetical protein LCDV1gp065 [Lymphocystis disease virus 1]